MFKWSGITSWSEVMKMVVISQPEKFYPTLFVESNKKTKYQTLNGEYVESVEPGTVRDCREFIKRYDGVDNFKIYGNDRYIYQYISEMYPEEEIKFDTSKIKIATIDIEVASENGFPDVESAAERSSSHYDSRLLYETNSHLGQRSISK